MIIDWLLSKAKRNYIVIIVLGYFLFPLYLLPMIIDEGDLKPLDLLLYYDADILYQMLAAYGERIRSRYFIGLLSVDLIYPFYYSLLMALVIAAIIKAIPLPRQDLRFLVLLPFVVLATDLIENLLLVSLLTHYPNKMVFMANIAGVMTFTKWLMFAGVLVVILYLLGVLFWQKRQRL